MDQMGKSAKEHDSLIEAICKEGNKSLDIPSNSGAQQSGRSRSMSREPGWLSALVP